MRADQKQITGVNRQCDGLSPLSYVQCKAFHLNGVQTELKCKPNVKRCKRFVFVGHSPLLHHNTLKTKAITLFQADHILTRFVFPPLHSAFNSLMERKKDFDAAAVRDMFQGNAGMQMTLLKLLDRHNEEMKARVGVDRAPTTMSTYVYTRRTLAEFIKTEFKVSDLAFGQLNEQFIRDYQDFCLEKKKLAMETVRHYLSILKKICRIAYKEGHSEKYHFCHFKLPKQKETTPKALSRENFEKLRDLEIPEKRRSHVITRDLFLFACYTGTAYADAVSITRENLFQDDEGSLWLKYRRKKTDYLGRVKLLPEALALIGKYRDDTRITLFPPQDYHTLRANMKSLRLMAGLSQDLVYHMGRHSFASLVTLEEGVPIETISKMLGHSNIKTTQIYARVTPKRLFEDMDRFVEATRDLKLIL